MKPPGAMDAKRPGAFVSSDAGGTSNVTVGVTPAMLLLRPRSRLLLRETAAAWRKARGQVRGVFLLVVVERQNESLHTREQAHTKLHAHATNTIRAGPGQSRSVCETTSAKG